MLHHGFEPFRVAVAVSSVISQRLARSVDDTLIPVVALLEPDDRWQEFICRGPELGQLRRGIKAYYPADLEAAGCRLYEEGRISRTVLELLGV